jgi:hypothetical protein
MMVPAEQSNAVVSPNGGPSTREGKEIARCNATRHGIRSPAPVVPGVEKAEEWEEHRDGVLDSLSPVGHLEFVLAERVALLSWRLHRVIRYETETIALYGGRPNDPSSRPRRWSVILGTWLGSACCWTKRPWRRSRATRRTSRAFCSRPCTNSKPCRSGGRAGPLPWQGWTWTDWRATEGGPAPLTRRVESSPAELRLYGVLRRSPLEGATWHAT